MLTEEQVENIVKRVAKEAAQEAVKDTLLLMGVRVDDPNSILNMQQDMKHLRESREGKEEFIKKSRTALMGVFITGILALITKGFWAEVSTVVQKVFSGGG